MARLIKAREAGEDTEQFEKNLELANEAWARGITADGMTEITINGKIFRNGQFVGEQHDND